MAHRETTNHVRENSSEIRANMSGYRIYPRVYLRVHLSLYIKRSLYFRAQRVSSIPTIGTYTKNPPFFSFPDHKKGMKWLALYQAACIASCELWYNNGVILQVLSANSTRACWNGYDITHWFKTGNRRKPKNTLEKKFFQITQRGTLWKKVWKCPRIKHKREKYK